MIYGIRVKQARELEGLTQEELASLVKRDQSTIAYIESGLIEPSGDLLEAIAQHTHKPISYFSQPIKAQLPGGSLLWRAHASITRREATEALRHAEAVFALGMHLLQHVNAIPVKLISRVERPELAARHTRQALGLPALAPIPLLVRTLERAGVWVLPIKKLSGRDAFSVWAPAHEDEVPIMAIAIGQPGDRIRFNIAHELGHLILHKQLPFKTVREIEDEAHSFAAEFLMPEEAMRKELLAPLTLTSVARLKPKWGVSMQALIHRAKDLKIISDRQYRYLFQQLSAKGWRTSEPSNLDVKVEKPRLIAKMAEEAYANPLKFGRLASELHIHESELRSIMDNFASRKDFEGDSLPINTGNVVQFKKTKKLN